MLVCEAVLRRQLHSRPPEFNPAQLAPVPVFYRACEAIYIVVSLLPHSLKMPSHHYLSPLIGPFLHLFLLLSLSLVQPAVSAPQVAGNPIGRIADPVTVFPRGALPTAYPTTLRRAWSTETTSEAHNDFVYHAVYIERVTVTALEPWTARPSSFPFKVTQTVVIDSTDIYIDTPSAGAAPLSTEFATLFTRWSTFTLDRPSGAV